MIIECRRGFATTKFVKLESNFRETLAGESDFRIRGNFPDCVSAALQQASFCMLAGGQSLCCTEGWQTTTEQIYNEIAYPLVEVIRVFISQNFIT